MRERVELAVIEALKSEVGRGMANREKVAAIVDAALDALTTNPGVAVLDAALGAPTQDENGINCFEILSAGEAFCAMIQAIKDGK